MTRYAGSGAYGLSMALHDSGAAAAELPEPGFIECLTLMPLGTLYLRAGRDLFVSTSAHRSPTRTTRSARPEARPQLPPVK